MELLGNDQKMLWNRINVPRLWYSRLYRKVNLYIDPTGNWTRELRDGDTVRIGMQAIRTQRSSKLLTTISVWSNVRVYYSTSSRRRCLLNHTLKIFGWYVLGNIKLRIWHSTPEENFHQVRLISCSISGCPIVKWCSWTHSPQFNVYYVIVK